MVTPGVLLSLSQSVLRGYVHLQADDFAAEYIPSRVGLASSRGLSPGLFTPYKAGRRAYHFWHM